MEDDRRSTGARVGDKGVEVIFEKKLDIPEDPRCRKRCESCGIRAIRGDSPALVRRLSIEDRETSDRFGQDGHIEFGVVLLYVPGSVLFAEFFNH